MIDTQIASEHTDLNVAHKTKSDKYKILENGIKTKYEVEKVHFSSTTLWYRGVRSQKSTQVLLLKKIINKELKIISTRVLIGGLNLFWKFNKTTSRAQPQEPTGIG